MIKLAAIAAAATSTLVLVACGSAAPSAVTTDSHGDRAGSAATLPITPAAKSDASGTWVKSYSDSVDLLQLVEAKGGVLSGSVTEVELPSSTSDPLKTTNVSFVGTRAKQNLSLTIDQGLGVIQTWTGTFSGDQIELTIPESNGSLGIIDFARSNTATYSSDVDQLQVSLNQSQQAAEDQAVEAARQTAQDNLTAGVTTLKNDVNGLGVQDKLPAAVAAVNQSLSAVTSAQQVALGAQTGSCSTFDDDVSAVGDAVSAVGDALSDGDDTVYSVTQAAGAVQLDISNVKDLESKLTDAGGQPDSSIESVLSQADQAQSAATTAANGADQQMKAFYQQANDLFNTVETAGTGCQPWR